MPSCLNVYKKKGRYYTSIVIIDYNLHKSEGIALPLALQTMVYKHIKTMPKTLTLNP